MKRSLARTTPDGRLFFLSFLGVGSLVLVAARLVPGVVSLLPPCPFMELTGRPCPTCGVTRAILALSHGMLREAVTFNPLFVGAGLALGFLALWYVAADAVGLRFLRVSLSSRDRRLVTALIAAGVVANWVYLLVR